MKKSPIPNLEDRLPSDRTYRIFGWSTLIAIALIVIYGFWLSQFFPAPRAVGFRLVVSLILLFNALWWATADRRLARHILSARQTMLSRLSIATFSVALNAPIVYMLIAGRMPDFLVTAPTWYAAAVTIWHLSLVTLMPILASIRLIALGLLALQRRFIQPAEDPEKTGSVANPKRRAWLHTAAASVPVALLGGATVTARTQEHKLLVRRLPLKAPWLPDRLRGLTITHISDLHVGRHYRPYMLRRLVDVVNDLKSDLILATGDIVDVSNDMLPPAVEAFRRMEQRYGLFNCIGNHDEIDNRSDFIKYYRQSLPLLINQRRSLEIGGERLTIAGLDYARPDSPTNRYGGPLENVRRTLKDYDAERDGPVIALAHHPHTFDQLAEHMVPLTLSGHTHGGQLMLTPPDSNLKIGAGRLLFRYVRGFYTESDSTLFVNSGVGNWFPLRLHAPAEVVQIQLI
ncbi:MAG: metallophosphoesterase [Phycisphaerales bacterium]|nr:metallophosphoesterase [Phycisphaerales bacterium]